jgi:hypothetical protein
MWQHRRKPEGSTANFLDGQPTELEISDKPAFVRRHVKECKKSLESGCYKFLIVLIDTPNY